MNHEIFSELVLPFLKVSTSTASFNILSKVNKLFYKELKTERDIQSVEEWFRDKFEEFVWEEETGIYYLSSERINSSVQFQFITSCSGTEEEKHIGTVSFNDDNTLSMFITSDESNTNIISRTFSNITTLDMLKSIFIDNEFHSEYISDEERWAGYEDEED